MLAPHGFQTCFPMLLSLLLQASLVRCSTPLLSHSDPSSTLVSTTASVSASNLASLAGSTTYSAICASQSYAPVVFPIRNVTLSDLTIRRGIAFNVGSPPQPLAMFIEGQDNETFLFDGSTTNCNTNWSRLECSNYLGGFFNEGASSSWSQAASLPAIGQPYLNAYDSHMGDVFGTDTVKINANLSLPTFPLGITRTGSTGGGGNSIGLGRNSTIIRALMSNKTIMSNTWSMFYGWMGAQTSEQLDGNIIIGGYDKAKIKDLNTNATQPIANPSYQCQSGYVVTVTDMVLNLSNGTDASLLGSSSGAALKACIDPAEGSNTISSDIWQRFVNISGSTPTGRAIGPYNYWSMNVLADGAYDGDLTIVVYPNLPVRIRNHQLVTPNVDVNGQGQEYLKNTTERNVLLNELLPPNNNDIPRLGRPFMSSAYFQVDYDHQQFTIWPSQPTVNQDLIAIGPPLCPSATPSPSSPSRSTNSIPGEVDSQSAKSSSSTSKRVVAGAVVGSLVAAAALCGTILWAFAKRRARHNQPYDQDHAAKMDEYKRGSEKSAIAAQSVWLDKPEMPADKHPPQEMPLMREPDGSLAPYEVSEISGLEAPMPRNPIAEMSGSPSRKSLRIEIPGHPVEKPLPVVPG